MRFWLDMGVDGAAPGRHPYLVERDGTNCENLPETHAIIKKAARRHRRRLRQPHDAGRSQPVAQDVRNISAMATNATWRFTSR
jgi:hypothetical protein